MDLKLRKNKKEKRIVVFIIYIIVVYTFILSGYSGIGLACNIAKFIFAILFIYSICNRVLRLDIICKLMLLFASYMLLSLIISSALYGLTIDVLFKEVMYEILPILLYAVCRNYKFRNERIYKAFILSCLILIVLGIPVFFREISMPFLLKNLYQNMRNTAIATGFGSYIGVIGMGYLSQLAFATILLKKVYFKYNTVLMIFFFAFSLFTLQRSAFLGLFFSIFVSFFQYNKSTNEKIKYIVILVLIVFIFELIIVGGVTRFFPFEINEYIQSIFGEFNITNAVNSRFDQMVSFNNKGIHFLFGHGMGTFSPNNPNNFYNISDASYYRIYNELGILGLILFLVPFIMILVRAIKKRNLYLVYLIVFSLISFYFNRTIWSIPSAYIFYLFTAMETPMYTNDKRL